MGGESIAAKPRPRVSVTDRNLSVQAYYAQRANSFRPQHRFQAGAVDGWATWSERLHPLVLGTLGRRPAQAPLRAQTLSEWTADGLVKRRFVIDVEPGLSAVGYLFRPVRVSQPLPAIIACHGHTPDGKDVVMGCPKTTMAAKKISDHHYDYGLQLAKAGFVTVAIDWRGFGERDDRELVNQLAEIAGRDRCNLNALRAEIFGETLLGQHIHDGRAVLDYLCDQPFVDSAKIGAVGLSFGATMALWLGLADSRIRAIDAACYADQFADFGLRDLNFCGSQVSPGLYHLCDVADLYGLIAPRPLLMQIGRRDECFGLESAMDCFKEVKQIYAAAAASDRLQLDLFDGGHLWHGRYSVEFFRLAFGVSC